MDKLTRYRQIIRCLIADYREYLPTDQETEVISVIDALEDHYLLVEIGWQRNRRIYHVIAHVRIKNGKFWVEEDWTKRGLIADLLSVGVPATDIVQATQPAYLRDLTEVGQLQAQANDMTFTP